MNVSKFLLILLFGWIGTGCVTILFEEAQPIDAKALKEIPKSLQGKYQVEDGVFAEIDRHAFTMIEFISKAIHMAVVDSAEDITIKKGLLYDANYPTAPGVPYIQDLDTIRYTLEIREAKKLSKHVVLKPFGRYFILNDREKSEEYWQAYILDPTNKDEIKFMVLGRENESSRERDQLIQDIQAITTVKNLGEKTYLINPDQKQLEQMKDAGLFTPFFVLKRVK